MKYAYILEWLNQAKYHMYYLINLSFICGKHNENVSPEQFSSTEYIFY